MPSPDPVRPWRTGARALHGLTAEVGAGPVAVACPGVAAGFLVLAVILVVLGRWLPVPLAERNR